MTYGLVWLIKASIQNFSFHGGLEVVIIYLLGQLGSHSDYKTNLSSQLDLPTGTELQTPVGGPQSGAKVKI